ncbi:hypothetical protein CJF42_25200 [Pseudoalteromonas sp. NBT06-2]|nr:hypothetical protein CJF42_25200 [Pseudoalteromonas sp. NBT06-2]
MCPTEILSNEPEPEPDAVPQKNIQIRYGQVPFINTNVANLIAMACMQAKDRRRFSVFAGGAGIGKTKAIEEYCKQNEFAILLNGSEQISGVQVLLQLCQKLGIPKSRNAPRNIENIIYTLRDSDRLIILDEADKCKPNALDPLRTISDHAMVGVTLVGNIQLVDKLRSQERYELIASRVCFWPKPMGQISVEDIQSLFIKLTQNSLTLSDNSDKWWVWLHKRVEGNARELVENLLPHLLKFDKKNKHKKIDRLFVNSIFANVLNKPAI